MTMHTRIAIAASTFTFLAACAGQPMKLTQDDLRSFSAQPQIYAVHHSPARIFWIESTGYSASGAFFPSLFVVGAQMQESVTLQKELGLADPAPRVKDRLVNRFQQHYGLKSIRVVSEPPKSDAVETLKELFQTGAVLDIRTTAWGIDNNRAKYSARIRLVQLSDSAVIWEAHCHPFIVDKSGPSPTRESLVANQGELLKAKLDAAADGCVEQLWTWAMAR